MSVEAGCAGWSAVAPTPRRALGDRNLNELRGRYVGSTLGILSEPPELSGLCGNLKKGGAISRRLLLQRLLPPKRQPSR